MNKRHKDVDRVATLLVLLHRKIEVQIVKYMKEQKNGGLKLLKDIGKQLHTTIAEGYETGFSIEDNFDFLKPNAEGNESMEGAEIGDQVMWEMLGNQKMPNPMNVELAQYDTGNSNQKDGEQVKYWRMNKAE